MIHLTNNDDRIIWVF